MVMSCFTNGLIYYYYGIPFNLYNPVRGPKHINYLRFCFP